MAAFTLRMQQLLITLALLLSPTTASPLLHLGPVLASHSFRELADAAPSLSNTTFPVTVFAPYDSSIHTDCDSCPVPFPSILRQQTIPGVFSLNYLRSLPSPTKIESLADSICHTITISGDNSSQVFISGVEITHPDIYNDGLIALHGIKRSISFLPSTLSCNVGRSTSLSFLPPPRPDDASFVTRMMLQDAMFRLRCSGYISVALALRGKYPDLMDLKSVTVFALSDAAMFSKVGYEYGNSFNFHVVPNRLLTARDLARLPAGTKLPTLNPRLQLVVTTRCGVGRLVSRESTINSVPIDKPDLILNLKMAVHGVSKPFSHLDMTAIILSRQAANIEVEGSGIAYSEYQLIKQEVSGLGRGKYSECSTTESSDDIEKRELEEVSDEDAFYFDSEENFSEPTVCYGPVTGVAGHMSKCMGPEDNDGIKNLNAEKETITSGYPQIERRKKLPDPVEKKKPVSLWSMIKDNVGKDLTRVCLPVYFNEPISSLQKCFEDLEYSFLLDRAYEHGKAGNSLLRVLNVAAFAVSGYASTEGRHSKPFNPLLGETYEADYPEKGVRFFSEKVSHHPTLIACHSEGKGWKFWGDSNLKSKFWGTSIQLDPVGTLNLEFDDGEVFQWNKVTTSICNLILGKVCLRHHGMMQIHGNRQYSCKLKFKEHSILDRSPHQVHGHVEDASGKKVATVFGKWDESMHYVNGDGNAKTKNVSDEFLLWKRSKPPSFARYNMTSFAITLNELTPGLQENLPPTDSRLRPDQRHLENGEYEKANGEKLRLEKRQRMVQWDEAASIARPHRISPWEIEPFVS